MDLRRSARLRSKRTVPVTPELSTRKRTRTYHIESQKEKEDREFEEIKKFKFKANPAPDYIFDSHPVGVPEKSKTKVTRAKTPIALRRTQKQKSKAGKKGSNKVMKRIKALPLPDLNKIFQVNKEEVKVTKPKPFSFEGKYSDPNSVKTNLLQKAVEEEKKKREFKATSLYETPAFTVDMSLSKSCTRVEPFKLSNPDFHERKLENQAKRKDDEENVLKEKRAFKATYPYAIFEKPFIPEKDSTYCVVEEFNLHSEKRGMDRKKYDMSVKEQKILLEKQMEADIEKQEKENKKEVAILRKKLVHKANDIGQYKKQEYENI